MKQDKLKRDTRNLVLSVMTATIAIAEAGNRLSQAVERNG